MSNLKVCYSQTYSRCPDSELILLKDDWLTIDNEHSAHAQKNQTWPESTFLLLTKRKAGSGTTTDPVHMQLKTTAADSLSCKCSSLKSYKHIHHKPGGFSVAGGHNSLLNPHLGRSFGGTVLPPTQILVMFFRNTRRGKLFLVSLPEVLPYVI